MAIVIVSSATTTIVKNATIVYLGSKEEKQKRDHGSADQRVMGSSALAMNGGPTTRARSAARLPAEPNFTVLASGNHRIDGKLTSLNLLSLEFLAQGSAGGSGPVRLGPAKWARRQPPPPRLVRSDFQGIKPLAKAARIRKRHSPRSFLAAAAKMWA